MFLFSKTIFFLSYIKQANQLLQHLIVKSPYLEHLINLKVKIKKYCNDDFLSIVLYIYLNKKIN